VRDVPFHVLAKPIKDALFLPIDDKTNISMTAVVSCVTGGDFTQSAKNDFMKGADPFLIAYALAHSRTVVSHEVLVVGERRKVKIPAICAILNVPFMRTFKMLKTEKAPFISKP
jgi:hypothetical protein